MAGRVSLLCLLALAGCAESSGADASTPAGADAGASEAGVRRLLERGMFGDLAMDDRLVDPAFELLGYEWHVLRIRSDGDLTEPRHWVRSAPNPTHTPILAVPARARNSGPVGIFGRAYADAPGLSISVWVGRRPADSKQEVEISLMAMNEFGSVQFGVPPDRATASMELDGVLWARYAQLLPGTLHGFIELAVVDYSPAALYLTGPSVLPTRARGGAELGGEPLRPEQRRLLRAVQRRRQAAMDQGARHLRALDRQPVR